MCESSWECRMFNLTVTLLSETQTCFVQHLKTLWIIRPQRRTARLAISAQHFVSDVNQARTNGALMFQWSRWRMKAVGGNRLWFHLASLSSVCLPAKASSLPPTHTSGAPAKQKRKGLCVCVCVLGNVGLFRSAWHLKISFSKESWWSLLLFFQSPDSFSWVALNIYAPPPQKHGFDSLNYRKCCLKSTTTKESNIDSLQIGHSSFSWLMFGVKRCWNIQGQIGWQELLGAREIKPASLRLLINSPGWRESWDR